MTAADTRERIARLLAWVLAVECLLLVGSGAYLVLFYRPDLPDRGRSLPDVARIGHRHMSILTVVTALALVVALLAARSDRLHRLVLAPSLLVGCIVASVTGYRLPWDELAVRAVTVGSDLKGFGPVFDDQVRFFVVDATEVSPGTARGWFVVHLAVGAAVVMAAAWLLRRVRRPRTAVPSDDRDPVHR
jgi:quinol-cytochrome oxidoreductase complex cytochrome b subunit